MTRHHRGEQNLRTPLWAVLPAAVALAALGGRWLLQGSGNVYTVVAKQFYVPDPDLDWRLSSSGPLWVGLDAIAAVAAIAVGIAILGYIAARWERRRQRTARWFRKLLWVGALIPCAVPVLAFASGGRPSGGRDLLPMETITPPSEGVRGHLAGVPAGIYVPLPGPRSAIVAKLEAGGETFEGRFSDVSGTFQGDLSDLRQPLRVELKVPAKSIRTGISLRDTHAQEKLKVDDFPDIKFIVTQLLGAERKSDSEITFSAKGVLTLLGRDHPLDVIGSVRRLDRDAGERLTGLADQPAFVVKAQLRTLRVDDTALENNGTFTANEVPLDATVIFVKKQHTLE